MNERAFGPVRFIPGPNRGKYPYCHSVYIEGPGVLIDPAGDRERLRRLREEEGVSSVWLSHWHEDHLAHLDLFDDRPLALHPADAPPLSNVEAFLAAYGIADPALRHFFTGLLTEVFHFRPRTPARALHDGEVIPLGSVTVEVFHTPGHTPGHLAFFFREPGVLFLGDYDLTDFGPWYGDRDSSIPLTRAAVARLRQVPARVWIAGHGPGPFEAPPGERWDAYLAVIDDRERRLLEHLAQPRTMEEIVSAWITYLKPREPLDFYRFGEQATMAKHLESLLREGRVVKEGEAYRRV